MVAQLHLGPIQRPAGMPLQCSDLDYLLVLTVRLLLALTIRTILRTIHPILVQVCFATWHLTAPLLFEMVPTLIALTLSSFSRTATLHSTDNSPLMPIMFQGLEDLTLSQHNAERMVRS